MLLILKADLSFSGRAVGAVRVQDDLVHLERLIPVLQHLELHRVQALHPDAVEVELVPDDLEALVDDLLPVHVHGGHGHLLQHHEVLVAQLAGAGLRVRAACGQHLLEQVHHLMAAAHVVLAPAAQQVLGAWRIISMLS